MLAQIQAFQRQELDDVHLSCDDAEGPFPVKHILKGVHPHFFDLVESEVADGPVLFPQIHNGQCNRAP